MDGKPLGDHPVTFVYKGQKIKTDDPACKEAFMNNPDLHLKEAQEAAKKHKKAPAKGQGEQTLHSSRLVGGAWCGSLLGDAARAVSSRKANGAKHESIASRTYDVHSLSSN